MSELPKKTKIKIIIVAGIIVLLVVLKLFVLKKSFVYAGTIETTKIDISARVTSVISSLHFKEGDRVEKDQLLLSLACEDYKLASQMATLDFERAARLYKQGSQSKEIYDQMKNKKDETDLKLSWCNITSPLSGIILNKYFEAGEMVTPGTRLFTLADLKNDIYAYVYVPHDLIHKISLGQAISGHLPEADQRNYVGTVTQIGEEAEFTPKNVQTKEERTRLVYAIKLQFKNEDETLKPGMTVEMQLPED